MTILITGGAGTLASDFLNYSSGLIEERIILTDIKPLREDIRIFAGQVSFIKVDSAKIEDLLPIFTSNKISRILHFAGSISSGYEGYKDNVESMINIIKLAEQFTQPKIFFPQSFLTRDCSQIISDKSRLSSPTSEYGIFKSACERYLEMYSGSYTVGIISISVSPKLTIGPIPAFAKRIAQGKPIVVSDTERDYLSPKSCAQAVYIASDPKFDKRVVAIGSGRATHTAQVAQDVANVLKKEVILPKYTEPGISDPPKVRLQPSGSLLDNGWEPETYTFNDIKTTVNMFLTGEELERQHHVF